MDFGLRNTQFRKVLPALHTILASVFGGRGLWLRNSILSRPFWGDSTFWDSTARFHVWPWAFKFAAVLNMPALILGLLLAWPLDAASPGLPEWISLLPALALVPLIWYGIGQRLDRLASNDRTGNSVPVVWIVLGLFTVVCGLAASLPQRIGGYTSYLPLGICVWLVVAFAVSRSLRNLANRSSRRVEAKRH